MSNPNVAELPVETGNLAIWRRPAAGRPVEASTQQPTPASPVFRETVPSHAGQVQAKELMLVPRRIQCTLEAQRGASMRVNNVNQQYPPLKGWGEGRSLGPWRGPSEGGARQGCLCLAGLVCFINDTGYLGTSWGQATGKLVYLILDELLEAGRAGIVLLAFV